MRRLLLQIAKIVGTPSEENWSQVHTFFPEVTDAPEEKISRRGQLLAVISLSALAEGIEIAAAGREIISRLHEEYYGDLSASPFEQLKRAVGKVSTEAVGEVEVEIVVASVVGKVLNVTILGEGRLVVCRKGKMATVLVGGAPPVVKTASGYLEDEDIVLIGTAEFFKLVAEGTLRAALAIGSPNEAAEVLTPIVHGQENGRTTGAVIVKVRERKVGETMPEVEKKETQESKLSETVRRFKKKLNQRLFFFLQRIQKTDLPRRQAGRSTKTMMTIALVLLLILGVSVIFGARQRKNLDQEKQVTTLLSQARAKKEEGEALLGLNPLKAKELLLGAQDIIRRIEPDGTSNKVVIEFKQELLSLLAKVSREHQITPAVWFDLELIKNGAKGDDWDVSGEQIIVLDKEKSSIYSLGITDKKSAILAGGENLGGSTQIAVSGEEIYVLTERGIWGIKLKIEKDEEWGEIIGLRVFGGSLYLLDKKGEIWKYPAGEGGFGTKQKWLNQTANFSDVVSMAIDGVVWILKSDGTILKYIRGVKDAFGVAGLSKPFSNPVAIWADSNQEHLYVLDKGNSRVVVLAKSGEYDSEYIWEGIKDVNDLVVPGEEKKIFLLSGSKIYEMEIK